MVGDGPIYAAGLVDGVLGYVYGGEFAGSDWGGQKVLWVSSPAYHGPALVRGHRLDGSDELGFDRGSDPARELRFAIETGVAGAGAGRGWRELPSYTRVRAPGCYAYQIDGTNFTELIVFEARPDR